MEHADQAADRDRRPPPLASGPHDTVPGGAPPERGKRAARGQDWPLLRRIGNSTPFLLVVIALTVIALSTRGITDEGTVAVSDMPRYLMDGAFLRDLVVNAPFGDIRDFALSYYVRYPALGLGHYAPLTAAMEAVAYSVLGVSVFSARVVIVACMLVAAWALFLVGRSIFGEQVAFLGTVLFVTTPSVVSLSRVATAEIPALALLLLALWAMRAYCMNPSQGRACALAVLVAASVYAKHTAMLVVPVYAVELWRLARARPHTRRQIGLALIVASLLLVPMAVLTVRLAPSKFRLVIEGDLSVADRAAGFLATLNDHASPWVLGLAGLALSVAVIRRDSRPLIFVWLIGVYFLGIALTASMVASRHTVYWAPALCMLAASTVAWLRPGPPRALAALALAAIAMVQGFAAFRTAPQRAEGYAAAARFLVENEAAPVVLYGAGVDSGLLPFFVRVHDPDRSLVVLRADKMLATSSMDRIVGHRISAPSEIYDVLGRFGVRHVVVEDVPYEDQTLQWLQQEVGTSRFRLLTRIPIRSNSPRLKDSSLSVYEFLDATPLPRDSFVRIDIPLVQTSIEMDMHRVLRTRIR